MRVFLSGPMGSGKSTVAKLLAARLGLRAVDLDAEVEARAGKSVAQIFAEQGEPAFRALEREVAAEQLKADGVVVALGGGTVAHLPTRRALIAGGYLFTLQAELSELAQRVDQGQGRPLLAGGDVKARLASVLEERAGAYAECHACIATTGKPPEQVVSEIERVLALGPIVVPMQERTYRVEVGAGLRSTLPQKLASIAPSGSALMVSDETVGPLWADPISALIRAAVPQLAQVRIGAGEAHKHIRTVEQIWEAALDAQLDRSSALLGVGGGVVGDLTGFAAATFLRGVPVGHVPTTLLAMVDSAVGGKTGFDTRHGKNLVGAFHQPSFVLCDTDVLATLPPRELRAGFAEVIKSAWIDSEAAVAGLERDQQALLAGDVAATTAAIRMSVGLKARIVTEDEREGGARALLNLGHTVGHAIEAAAEYTGFLHGEAVALGMVAAFRLAMRFGSATAEQGERMTRLLAGIGLPTDLDRALTPKALSFLGSDKKRRGSALTLVLPAEPGNVVLRKVPLADVVAALS
jgi:shikimate kinase/3-dehydroquinate synthase